MFYYFEYTNYIVNLHINEKILFYSFKYLELKKVINLSLKKINIVYNLSPLMYDFFYFSINNLFFYTYFKLKLFFNSTNKIMDSYKLSVDFNTHTYLYFFLLGFFKKTFNEKCFMNTKKINKYTYYSTTFKFILNKFNAFNTNKVFNDVKNLDSIISFSSNTTSTNIYLNRILFSHVLFNV